MKLLSCIVSHISWLVLEPYCPYLVEPLTPPVAGSEICDSSTAGEGRGEEQGEGCNEEYGKEVGKA